MPQARLLIRRRHAAQAKPASTTEPAASLTTPTADMTTGSAAGQENAGFATPTPYAESRETNKLPPLPPVHDATTSGSDESRAREQQANTPTGGSMASVQSLLPSDPTSFGSCTEGRSAPTQAGTGTIAEFGTSIDALLPLLQSYRSLVSQLNSLNWN